MAVEKPLLENDASVLRRRRNSAHSRGMDCENRGSLWTVEGHGIDSGPLCDLLR